MVQPLTLLRLVYLGRLALAGGVFVGAVLMWRRTDPVTTLLATLALIGAVGATLVSGWHSHVRGAKPGRTFLYIQSIVDVALVTVAVHVTGGASSDFAPLYILVIAASAVLLPLPGGMLIGALASMVYVADVVWWHAADPPGSLLVQVALFAVLALVTAYLGERVRHAGTALVTVESQLRQLRLDTDDILAALETGVVTVDGMGRLVYANAAAERLLRVRARELLGKPAVEALDERAPGLGTVIRRTSVTRRPVRRFETLADASGAAGTDRVVGGRTAVLEREDGAPWVTAVIQDITDSKRLEELHARTARLEAVAELAASLAHEIKNPLASIRSAVEQIDSPALAPDDRNRLRDLVLRESDRLSRLLTDFIDYARVEVQERTRIDLAKLAAEATALAAKHPDAAPGVDVAFCRDDEPVWVRGDADLLHRTVFNLVLNAIQHAGDPGRVCVEVGRVDGGALPPGTPITRPVRVCVADDGPGIPPADVRRIFDPFFTTRKGGTGLGLALVHRAVEAHAGAIFVDSAPDCGARFTIYLPGDEAGPEAEP